MNALEYTPTFSSQDARRLASRHFDLHANEVSELPSERDQNFLVSDIDGRRWVLKISNGLDSANAIDGQNQMMRHLAERIDFCPLVRPAADGSLFNRTRGRSGFQHIVRMVSFIEGTPLADIAGRSGSLLHSLGAQIGQLTKALRGFEHPRFPRSFHWDLANGLDVVNAGIHRVQEAALRDQIKHCVSEFTEFATCVLTDLPTSVIHNDANDGNVIVASECDSHEGSTDTQLRVCGIIDFGDSVYSWTIGELAIATAYAILGSAEPLQAACHIVRGYAQIAEIGEEELTALFGLIRLRMCVSAVMAAEQQLIRPDDKYLTVSQIPIRKSLTLLCRICHRDATQMLREAANGTAR